MLDLLSHAPLLKQFQIINGRKPEQIIGALEGGACPGPSSMLIKPMVQM
jgi:hypothetical protein